MKLIGRFPELLSYLTILEILSEVEGFPELLSKGRGAAERRKARARGVRQTLKAARRGIRGPLVGPVISTFREAASRSRRLNLIVEAIKDAVEETPPELVADIIRGGVTLAGGTAQLPGLDFLIAQKTGIKTIVAKDPMTCVVRGTAKILENPRLLRRVRVV